MAQLAERPERTRGLPPGVSPGTSPAITVREAVALTSLSKDTLLRHLRAGRLTGRKVHGRVLLNRQSVLALLPQEGPPPPAVEQALALLPQLSDEERLAVARAALAPRTTGGMRC